MFILLTISSSSKEEESEIIEILFLSFYTIEMALKILAYGFITRYLKI
jgi:hypothetical protein